MSNRRKEKRMGGFAFSLLVTVPVILLAAIMFLMVIHTESGTDSAAAGASPSAEARIVTMVEATAAPEESSAPSPQPLTELPAAQDGTKIPAAADTDADAAVSDQPAGDRITISEDTGEGVSTFLACIDGRVASSHSNAKIYKTMVDGFTGDMGDLFACYQNLDIDGDGLTDTLYREDQSEEHITKACYTIKFGNGTEFAGEWDSENVGLGRVLLFTFCDMDGDGIQEITLENDISTADRGYYAAVSVYWKNGDTWTKANLVSAHATATQPEGTTDLVISVDEYGITETIPYISVPSTLQVYFEGQRVQCISGHGLVLYGNIGYSRYKSQIFAFDETYAGNGTFTLNAASTTVAEQYWPEYYAAYSESGSWYDDIECMDALGESYTTVS